MWEEILSVCFNVISHTRSFNSAVCRGGGVRGRSLLDSCDHEKTVQSWRLFPAQSSRGPHRAGEQKLFLKWTDDQSAAVSVWACDWQSVYWESEDKWLGNVGERVPSVRAAAHNLAFRPQRLERTGKTSLYGSCFLQSRWAFPRLHVDLTAGNLHGHKSHQFE